MEVTVLAVVEKLTFMFGEHVVADEITVNAEPWVSARMEFSGDVHGSLEVAVPQSLQPEIAANILGLETDGEPSPEVLDDALRELLNVVCGHVIVALAGNRTDFDLTPPRNAALALDQVTQMLGDPDTTCYLMDDEPLLLNLKFAQRWP